jgi:hypothetical protein
VNLGELAKSLPNGFHDSELRRFEMDYTTRQVTCDLDVWIGRLSTPGERELYRSARLTLGGVAYFSIDPPDERDPWLRPGPVTIDAGIGEPVRGPFKSPAPPVGSFRGYFYVGELNAFVHFVAAEASLEWRGNVENRDAKRGEAP